MAETTKIQWTDHTFNPWRGCTKISTGCVHCYAETLSHRNPKTLGVWGDHGTRVMAAEAMWREPLKWNRWAETGVCPQCHGRIPCGLAGRCYHCDGTGNIGPYRARVFCASLADVFEDWQGGPEGIGQMTCHKTGEPLSVNERGHIWPMGWPSLFDGDDWGSRPYAMGDVRQRLFALIGRTPWLDWQLLTKRPGNMASMVPPSWASGWPANAWAGTSVEDQASTAARIPHLLRVPAAVRFLSCEPLLGPQDLSHWLSRIQWVIIGGESGPHARPCQFEWIRDLVRQCQAAGVACFVKQLGSKSVRDGAFRENDYYEAPGVHREQTPIVLRDPKGGDIEEFPVDLRVREFPNVK